MTRHEEIVNAANDYVTKTHSAATNEFQTAMNIAVLKAYIAAAKWADGTLECKVEKETKSHNNMCKQLIDEMNPNVEVNVKTKPEPKFKRGDFVFSGINSSAMKVIDRCYDEHWRYQIFDDVNEYWFFEKELKKVEIGDVVYSKVWKEKVIVREFCDDKFILVADFNGKLLKSLPSLIEQIKETKPKLKFKVGDIIAKAHLRLRIVKVESDRYIVEERPGINIEVLFKDQDEYRLVKEEGLTITTVDKAAKVFAEMLIELCPELLGFGGAAKEWENEFIKRLEE